MRGLIKFTEDNAFKVLVFASICVIFYYTAGSKVFNRQNYTSSQSDNCSVINSSQLRNNQEGSNNEAVLKWKPLSINTFVNEEKINMPVINNVRFAELKNDEQTIVIEDTSQQQGTDVIIAAKGVRAKWIFRFKDGKACNGKIYIERLSMIIPITENEMEMILAPWKDFTITCDKGKFNYYIKVIDNMSAFINTTNTQANNTPKGDTAISAKTSTKSSSASSASVKQSTKEADTQIKPEPSPSSGSNSTQGPVVNNEDENTTQEKPKKKGILDHLFNHHH